jgi:hypothetical protein
MIGLLLIGVGLIVAPRSMSMFSRSSDGQKMVNGFRPIMQPASVKTTAMYYNDRCRRRDAEGVWGAKTPCAPRGISVLQAGREFWHPTRTRTLARDRELDLADPRLPAPLPVAVAMRQPIRRHLATAGADLDRHLGLHQLARDDRHRL